MNSWMRPSLDYTYLYLKSEVNWHSSLNQNPLWQSPNVSITLIMAMGCRQCLPLSVFQLKGKHCRNGIVDTFGHYYLSLTQDSNLSQVSKSSL